MVQLNAHEDVNICNEFSFVWQLWGILQEAEVTQVLQLAFHLNDRVWSISATVILQINIFFYFLLCTTNYKIYKQALIQEMFNTLIVHYY